MPKKPERHPSLHLGRYANGAVDVQHSQECVDQLTYTSHDRDGGLVEEGLLDRCLFALAPLNGIPKAQWKTDAQVVLTITSDGLLVPHPLSLEGVDPDEIHRRAHRLAGRP